MWPASWQPTTATNLSPSRGIERAFAEQLYALGVTPSFALAVSGGGDSAALLHLVAGWARECDIRPEKISVLTVDHGLRPASRAEAEQVAGWCRALGFDHHILAWEGEKPASGVQAAARAARRELMCGWCRERHMTQLLMAHTADDQLETVSMRLARGSGIVGLAGMAAEADGIFGVRILRPLLGASRADLRDWLSACNLGWIEDPSNENTDFERVRVRQALAGDARAPADLFALVTEASAARAALDAAADRLLSTAAEVHAAGWARVDLEAFRTAPHEVSEHALTRLLHGLGGRHYPPRRESLTRLRLGLAGHDFTGATLSGCRIVPEGRNSALFGREGRNLSCRGLTARQWQLWDNRFEIWCAEEAEVLSLAAVGLDAFEGAARDQVKVAVPPPFRGTLPMIRWAEGGLAVPHAGVGGGSGRDEELKVVFKGMGPFGPLEPLKPPKRM